MLSRLIPEHSFCLDLGCGTGALGKFLVQSKQCIFDGLTHNPQEAELARQNYRDVKVNDLDSTDITQVFPHFAYDFVICADVLEHLRQPEKILEQAKKLLKPEGTLLISIPNAGYAGLVVELMHGNFNYREEGLLDKTHLRFFTRKSFTNLLSKHGWHIHSLDTVKVRTCDSEFNSEFEKLPPTLLSHVLSFPDALTYQFIAAAKLQPNAQPLEAPVLENHASFVSHLYLGFNGQFDEQRKLTSWGCIGKAKHSVEFALPADVQNLDCLRLDPADRAGYLHLYSVELLDAQRHSLWKWSASEGPLSGACNDLIAADNSELEEFQRFFMLGNDPSIVLDIPKEILSRSANGFLKITMDWPVSADYVALEKQVQLFKEKNQEKIIHLEKSVNQYAENEKNFQTRINELESSLNYHKAELENLLQRTRNYFNPTSLPENITEKENTFSHIHAVYDEVEKRFLMRVAKKLYK